ncbi:uncharacterized protein [Lepeophtheirus salmonis]|uniref:uncharacterized protein n=1 Tax=Lepeophtheirus salmonis TaxID=72036 RepID=UPI001AE71381|nr:uncharacterized protein LOC121130592 [Lepeophtheirus salmonis]
MDNSEQKEPGKETLRDESMRDPLELDENPLKFDTNLLEPSGDPLKADETEKLSSTHPDQESNMIKAGNNKEARKNDFPSRASSTYYSNSSLSKKKNPRNFFCHMPKCRRTSFVQGYAYLRHLRSHKISSVYGCSICKLLTPGINAIISHIRATHRIKRHLCVYNFYVEKALCSESPKSVSFCARDGTNSLPDPPPLLEKIEPVVVKHKKQLVCVIDVNNITLTNNGRRHILDDLAQFVNVGLYDSLLDIVC